MRSNASVFLSISSSCICKRPRHSGHGMASALGLSRAGAGIAIGVSALPPGPKAKSRSKSAVSFRSLPASLRRASWATRLDFRFLFFLPVIIRRFHALFSLPPDVEPTLGYSTRHKKSQPQAYSLDCRERSQPDIALAPISTHEWLAPQTTNSLRWNFLGN